MRKGKFLSTRELVLCALFSALTAVGAYIRIPLPMLTLTLQFFFTNLAALLLGRRLGAFAAAGYVLAGLAGLPAAAWASPTCCTPRSATSSASSPGHGPQASSPSA